MEKNYEQLQNSLERALGAQSGTISLEKGFYNLLKDMLNVP